MIPVSRRQKQISVVLLYSILNGNVSSCALMTRLIPKSLFRRVDSTSNDISKWTLIQWEDLFNKIGSNFCTATEQWDQGCREEMMSQINRAQDDFQENWQVLSEVEFLSALEAINKSRDGTFDPKFSGSVLQIRWNYEEYEIKYKGLERKLPIWKYYLEELYEEEESPKLKVPINNVRKFWDELSLQLISCEDYYIKRKIYQTMILVYKEYFDKIKELGMIPFLVKVLTLDDPDSVKYHYLVLQLIMTAVNVSDSQISNQNIRKFNERGGLNIIRFHIQKKFFFENLDDLNYVEIRTQALEKQEIKKKTAAMSGKPNQDCLVFNFSSGELPREAYHPIFKKSNEILLALSILKVCISKSKSQSEDMMLFPRPMARQVISEKESVNLFNQLLIIKDKEIVIAVQEIISIGYFNKFSYKHILNSTNYFERSLFGMTELRTISVAAKNFREVFFLIQNEMNEDVKKVFGRFATYGYLDPEYEENEKERQTRERVLEVYPLFKSLPTALLSILVRNGPEEFTKVFSHANFQMPTLLWNSEMKKQLMAEMIDKFRGEFERLKINHDKFLANKLSSGIFEPLYQPCRLIDYKALKKEIICDTIFLKIWVLPEYDEFDLQETIIPRIIPKLFKSLDKKVDNILNDPNPFIAVTVLEKLKEIYILLKAYLKIISQYSVSAESSFTHLLKLIEIWNIYIFDEEFDNHQALQIWELIIIAIMKIIKFSISNSTAEVFEEFKKLTALKKIIIVTVSKILNKILHENFCSYNCLRIIHAFIKIVKQVQISSHNFLEIFADIQTSEDEGYDFPTTLNLICELYTIYFTAAINNKFSIIFDKNRFNTGEALQKSIYLVYEMHENSNVESTLERAKKDLEIDPSQTNVVSFLKDSVYSTPFHVTIETKLMSLTIELLELIEDISPSTLTAVELMRSKIYIRLLLMATFNLPREIRTTQEMSDSNFHLVDQMKSISDSALRSLKNLVFLMIQGSLNSANLSLDEILFELDEASINVIKESTDIIKFEDNKKLEDGLTALNDAFGPKLLNSIIKMYFEMDRLDILKDDLTSVEDSQAKGYPAPDFTRSTCTSRLQTIMKAKPAQRVLNNLKSQKQGHMESEIMIMGVYLKTYVHSPYRLPNPTQFIHDACQKLVDKGHKNEENLVLILKSIICVVRDEPDLDLTNSMMNCLIQMYEDKEHNSNEIRNLLTDIFIALSIMIVNLTHEVSPGCNEGSVDPQPAVPPDGRGGLRGVQQHEYRGRLPDDREVVYRALPDHEHREGDHGA
jgi:hypothetical protein